MEISINFPPGNRTAAWTGDGFTGSESWGVDFRNGVTDRAKNKSRLATLMVSSDPDYAGKNVSANLN